MRYAIGVIALAAAGTAMGQGYRQHDLVNCLWKDGRVMDRRDCDTLRKQAAEEEPARERQRLQLEAAQKSHAEAVQAQKEHAEAERVRIAKIEAEAQAQIAANKAAVERGRAETEREEAAHEKAARKICGKDYGATHVGMTLDRFEQCTDGAGYVTETVAKGQTVEIYRSTFYFLHVVDGVIVAYTRRTH